MGTKAVCVHGKRAYERGHMKDATCQVMIFVNVFATLILQMSLTWNVLRRKRPVIVKLIMMLSIHNLSQVHWCGLKYQDIHGKGGEGERGGLVD